MSASIQIAVTDLKQVVTGLSKILTPKGPSATAGQVRGNLEGLHTLRLSGADLNTFVSARVGVSAAGELPPFGLVLAELKQALKAAKQDVSLVMDGEGRLRCALESGQISLPLTSVAVQGWPATPIVEGPPRRLEDRFKDELQKALACAGPDSGRKVLQGACLEVRYPEGHYVIGADGRHLFAANTFRFDLPGTVIIPSGKFLRWSGFLADGEWKLSVQVDGQRTPQWLKLESDHWTFITRPVAGEYPHWQQVLPAQDGPVTRLELSAEAVASLLRILACLPGEAELNHPVQLCCSAVGGLTLRSRAGPTAEWTEVRMPGLVCEGTEQSVTLDRRLLAKALRFGFRRVEITGAFDPVVFRTATAQLVAMPLRDPVHEARGATVLPPSAPLKASEPSPGPEPSACNPQPSNYP